MLNCWGVAFFLLKHRWAGKPLVSGCNNALLTLPETHIAVEQWCLGNCFPFGKAYFLRGYVSFGFGVYPLATGLKYRV